LFIGKILRVARYWLTLGFLVVLPAGPAAQESSGQQGPREQYYAVAQATSGAASGASRQVTFYIDGYTSDTDTHNFAVILKKDGPAALVKAMNQVDVGRVAPTGRTGTVVSMIRSRPFPDGRRRVMMVTNRTIAFFESYNATRTKDYPFGVVELLLNKDGKGTGSLIVAAKIKFTKSDSIEIENYGIDPIRLVNVQREK